MIRMNIHFIDRICCFFLVALLLSSVLAFSFADSSDSSFIVEYYLVSV